jgi:(2R)-3-sulfolactate dehydrogenase (NADP+)
MSELAVGELRRLAVGLLVGCGVPRDHAERTASILVLADVWGRTSHGLMRLPYYLARLHAGGCRPDAQLVAGNDTGPVVVYDGGNGLGHWQVWEAAQAAAKRCAEYGISAVAVSNSSHCGALATYVYPMIDAGQVGLVFSTGPAVMPPWGGSTPVLSTSPLAAGVPSRPEPIVVDMATSAVARGRIAAAAQAGRPVPEGWALAPDGSPTTDPVIALRGMLAPLGGAKGYALALLVESLTAGLVGPLLAAQVPDMFDAEDDAKPQGIGHLVLALDPARFGIDGTGDGSGTRLDELAALVHEAGGRIPGAGRIAPAALGDEVRVAVAPETLERLRQWAERLGGVDSAEL